MSANRSEQEEVRLEKLKELEAEGFSYPNDSKPNVCAGRVAKLAEESQEKEPADRPRVLISGRLVAMRKMGKAAFCHIQDVAGRLQIYVRKDDVGEESFAAFKKFDIGDLIEVEGYPFYTKTEEPSLYAESVRLLVKSLHPLPEKWHGLTDIEQRYRKRYLDLIVNPDVKKVFIKRAEIIAFIRKFFNERKYTEVETPMLSDVASGASARPFETHHNSLDLDLNLRIALELPLKKLVVGGIERVYEIGRVFRNEGISVQHNPEFSMIEFYQAYATYEDMMDLTEDLITGLCDDVIGSRQIMFGDKEVDYTPPWQRLTMVEAIQKYTDLPSDNSLSTLEDVQAAATALGDDSIASEEDYGMGIYKLFDKFVEHQLIAPTFVTRHPLSVSPLARKSADDERFTDRFELFIAGMEVANAFSELNDPVDQRERFAAQAALKAGGDEEAMELDEDFISALEYGMPPTAGEGIGIDRLVMLLTGSESIRDVILFPQMRPGAL